MKFIRIINKADNFLYFLSITKNKEIAYILANNNYSSKNKLPIKANKESIIFKNSGNAIKKSSFKIFQYEIEKLITCLNNKKFKVLNSTKEGIEVTVDDVVLLVNSNFHLFTFYEIFYEKIYDIKVNETVAVMDIGMNVGYASIFFANKNFVSRVYAYEPFQKTYYGAIKNIDLNKELKNKIIPHNFGISDKSGTIVVPEAPAFEPGASINKDFISKQEIFTNKNIEVKIKSITDEIECIHNIENKSLIIKIDCEGEEYAIFESLNTHRYLFDFIKVFIIEWHLKGPDDILKVLHRYDFKTLQLSSSNEKTGMIYAFK